MEMYSHITDTSKFEHKIAILVGTFAAGKASLFICLLLLFFSSVRDGRNIVARKPVWGFPKQSARLQRSGYSLIIGILHVASLDMIHLNNRVTSDEGPDQTARRHRPVCGIVVRKQQNLNFV